MSRIYISGPITSYATDPAQKAAEEATNLELFRWAASLLQASGRDVWNPADLIADAGTPWEQYMRACLPGLMLCSEVVLLPGWEHSRGARLERHVALELGLQVKPLEWHVVRAEQIAAT